MNDRLTKNELGHQIDAESIAVPSSSPYVVALNHHFIRDDESIEIWQNDDKSGTKLTEEAYDVSVSESGKFQVDYDGVSEDPNTKVLKNKVFFHEDEAGLSFYVWYKSRGDIYRAEDVNSKINRVEGADGEIPVFKADGHVESSGSAGTVLPTSNEKAALDGTGTPSSENKYVTNDDGRFTDMTAHVEDEENPHKVDKTDVGLSAVTNDAQVKKISSSTNERFAVWDGTTGDLLKVGGKSEADFADKAVANTWSKAQTGATVALTDEATIAVDASLGNVFRVVLEGNRTLSNPTNAVGGWTFNVIIKQDGDGSRTLAFGNKYAFPDDADLTLTTAANAVDILSGIYDSTDDRFHCVLNKDSKVPS